AHLSVPLRLSDGRVYGTFCCFSFLPDHTLNQRDVQMMHAFAELAAVQIEVGLELAAREAETVARVNAVIARGGPAMVHQPIYRLDDDQVVGIECLACFPDCETRPPDLWFAEAAEVGLGVELELAALRAALASLPYFPDRLYLAVNLSPQTLLSGGVEAVLAGVPAGRVVLEITEHAVVSDYAGLQRVLEPLRSRVRIAIDDAGAGYSGLRHILDLRPDIIKLDMSLTRGIDSDPARSALAGALVTFARTIGGRIVAEGVETRAELAALRTLGVDCAQGYYLRRPMPLPAAVMFVIAREFRPEGACAVPRRVLSAGPKKRAVN
ncbi:MAG: sensor domain-containing phosphodiesterase, partial [Gammaproteobacteria bacterium]